jgi:hypothetical protein
VQPGAPMSLRVWNAPVGSTVRFAVSMAGDGDQPCVAGGNVCGALLDPVTVGVLSPNSSGVATLTLDVPTTVPTGRVLLFQALWNDGPTGDTTQVVRRRSQP